MEALVVIFLIISVALLIASYWRGALIGPGLASVVVAVYLLSHLTQQLN
jgi:sugar phosphate permease